ncbi:hypothetical protein Dsin_022928 [Dipteronia sinensis]|uniref:Uncharacterized protein n=1 Tax=Dipteronia sinensis TaxID=43782 RepID=A0AAE0A2B2_9ROSI|nr:hypothetical protein Dsin_022928 [Dipteronia sinensis]
MTPSAIIHTIKADITAWWRSDRHGYRESKVSSKKGIELTDVVPCSSSKSDRTIRNFSE